VPDPLPWPGPLTKSFSSPAADGLRPRKRGHTAHSRGFASSYAAGLVAKRLECGAFPRFGLDFVNGPVPAAAAQHQGLAVVALLDAGIEVAVLVQADEELLQQFLGFRRIHLDLLTPLAAQIGDVYYRMTPLTCCGPAPARTGYCSQSRPPDFTIACPKNW